MRNKCPRAKQVLRKSGRWLFLLLILMQTWLSIVAAAGRLEPEGDAEVPKITIVSDTVRSTKVDLDGKGLREKQMEKFPKLWKLPNGAGWTDMRKEEKRLNCTLLNGSAWSTEMK